jgi:3-oxoacyl-[acyl-carrier protein] reductase
MTTDLTGKVALVTGGSKGIGRCTCQALAKAGASVVINYSSDSSSAESLVKEIGSERAHAIKADAGSIQGAEEMINSTLDRFGRLNIVIANAGEYQRFILETAAILTSLGILPMKGIEDTTEEDFNRTYALNVKGPYFLVQVRLHTYTSLLCQY